MSWNGRFDMKKLKEFNITKRVKLVAVVLAAAAVLGGSAYYMLSPDELEVVAVDEGKVAPKLIGVGNVAGDHTMTIYAPISGEISQRYVNAGTRVSEGEMLVAYKDELQQQVVDVAATDVNYSQQVLSAAAATKAKYQSDYDTAKALDEQYKQEYDELAKNIHELDSKKYKGDYTNEKDRNKIEEEKLKLQDELAEAESKLKDADYELQRLQNEEQRVATEIEQASNITSNSSLDGEDGTAVSARELAARNAQAALNGINAGLSEEYDDYVSDAQSYTDEIYEINSRLLELQNQELELPLDGLKPAEYKRYTGYQQQLESLNNKWAQVKTDMSTAQSLITVGQELKSDEATLAHNKQLLTQAQKELEKAHGGTTAPANGIVTECMVDAGAYVEKGSPIMEMQSDNSYIVKMMVSRFDISSVKKGQKAKLMIGDKKYKGKVSRISQNAINDASGKPKASIEISIKTDEDLIVGLESDVTVKLDKEENAVRIPTACVYTDDDGSYVYVIEGGSKGKVTKKYIKTGLADDDYTQISEGLSAGEKVISDAEAINYEGEVVKGIEGTE